MLHDTYFLVFTHEIMYSKCNICKYIPSFFLFYVQKSKFYYVYYCIDRFSNVSFNKPLLKKIKTVSSTRENCI